MRKYLLLLVCLTITLTTYGQSSTSQLDKTTSLEGKVKISKVFSTLEKETEFVLSYNPLAIDLMGKLNIPRGLTWNKILDLMKDRFGLEFQIDDLGQKILITPSSFVIVTGVVKDSASLESLTGVVVYSQSHEGVFTNEEGYFRIKVPRADKELLISNLGYRSETLSFKKAAKQNFEVHLSNTNQLPALIISDTNWNQLTSIGPWKNNDEHVGKIKGIGGSPDLISKLKTIPGVSVGYEAQNGFLVRGGGPDQNLVLVDGVPIFETTHLGGISSVFSEDIIKSADLYKGAVPARFGGRLSSVLDIRLKDGNRKEFNRSVSIGAERIGALIEGPLGDSTSFILLSLIHI